MEKRPGERVSIYWRRRVNALLKDKDGTVWVGTALGGPAGRLCAIRAQSYPELADDGITTLYEDARGRIWVSGYNRLAVFENGKFTAIASMPGGSNFVMTGDNHGGLWLGVWFSSGHDGLVHLVEGKITEELPAQKLGGGPVLGIAPDPDGGIWVGLSSGGLVYVREGQIRKVPLNEEPDAALWVMGLSRDRHEAL